MKKLAVIALVTSALAFQSCGSFKRESSDYNEPCQELVNHKKYIQGAGQWTQIDPGQASKAAARQARVELANSMKLAVTEVAKDYSKDVQISGDVQFEQKLENMGITVVDQLVTNSYIVCKKVVKLKEKNKDGRTLYRAYVTVQVDKKEFIDGVIDAVSDEEELRLDVKAEIYEEKFDKALEDYRNRQ